MAVHAGLRDEVAAGTGRVELVVRHERGIGDARGEAEHALLDGLGPFLPQ